MAKAIGHQSLKKNAERTSYGPVGGHFSPRDFERRWAGEWSRGGGRGGGGGGGGRREPRGGRRGPPPRRGSRGAAAGRPRTTGSRGSQRPPADPNRRQALAPEGPPRPSLRILSGGDSPRGPPRCSPPDVAVAFRHNLWCLEGKQTGPGTNRRSVRHMRHGSVWPGIFQSHSFPRG